MKNTFVVLILSAFYFVHAHAAAKEETFKYTGEITWPVSRDPH
ncbi:MAG: hypothetical protein ACXVB4_19125 [Pseudobdellovibrionaceae bacterium]